MKQLISTKLFLSLQEVSKKGTGADLNTLEKNYDEFVLFLSSETALSIDKAIFVSMLFYARTEFAVLGDSKMLKRNAVAATCLQKAIWLIDHQIDWLKQQLLTEKNASPCPLSIKPFGRKKPKWTGTQVELVELVYSLHEAKAIDNGHSSLKELFFQLGEFFDFHVTDYYRFFGDIANRVGDRTLFLDRLKKRLMWRLERSDNRRESI